MRVNRVEFSFLDRATRFPFPAWRKEGRAQISTPGKLSLEHINGIHEYLVHLCR